MKRPWFEWFDRSFPFGIAYIFCENYQCSTRKILLHHDGPHPVVDDDELRRVMRWQVESDGLDSSRLFA